MARKKQSAVDRFAAIQGAVRENGGFGSGTALDSQAKHAYFKAKVAATKQVEAAAKGPEKRATASTARQRERVIMDALRENGGGVRAGHYRAGDRDLLRQAMVARLQAEREGK